ncbi:hypothetical protein Q674_11770 [Acinetobacter sp. COS3]|uniref:hypothetical protein n=1 Tax=Acinetobacter sp. COS3 TaxID=1397525 RepID=UPI0003B837D5|nr:hypothetical protein [Acinetobacter sp. COS3]ERS02356.1 hypothetical protein Q674_11770 [Acinetobacter sp. COS3]
MFKKNDAPLLHSAYMSKIARTTQPHPSPVDIGEVSNELSKVRLPSQTVFPTYGLARQTFPETVDKLIKSMQWVHHLPWVNGTMNLRLHPQLFLCIELAKRHGVVDQQLSWGADPIRGSNFIREFQDILLTHHFKELKEGWDDAHKFSDQELSDALKAAQKESNGFAFHEFISIMDSSHLHSPQLNQFIEDVKNGFINNLEDEQLLAVLLKKEPLPNRQMKLRFIILIKRDFLDSPAHLTNFSFFEKIKFNVEQTYGCHIFYDPSLLNGYMQSNLFHKKTQSFKEQIKQLRIYLTGTDALYRIGSVEPTFSVLHTKVKTQNLEGV